MASTTPNIGLTLPTGAEKVSRQIINDNNTKIDTAIGTLNSKFSIKTVTETIKSNISGYVQFPANRAILNAMNGNYNKCIIFKNPGSTYFMARGYHTYQNTTQVNFDASTDYSITYDYIEM